MKLLKRILPALTAAALTAALASSVPASAVGYNFQPEGVKIQSEAVYMENLDSGDVIIDINADEVLIPASLTKIMTCVLLLDAFGNDIDDMKKTKVSAGSEAFDELEGTYCSTAGIQRNEKISYYDLMCALMIPSACEAANIIAVNIGGSLDGFVQMMNDKAAALGMKNTVYYNAHGLDLGSSNNMTTCRDQAVLCKYAMNNYPVFLEITSMQNYTMKNGTTIVNTNVLLDETSDLYYGYVSGIKTGFMDSSGRCLASTASKNGFTYLTISMKAPYENKDGEPVMYNCQDHKNLYMWAFDNLDYQVFVQENEEITEVPVEYGSNADYVILKPANEISQIWLSTVDMSEVKKNIVTEEHVVAPVYAGDTLGHMDLVYNGETIASVKLVATSDVGRAALKAEAKVAGSFFSSTQFKVCLVIIILVIALYIIIFKVYVNRKHKKRLEEIKIKYHE